MRRFLYTAVGGCVLAILLGGHYLFWYAPRDRPMEIGRSRLAGGLDLARSSNGRSPDWVLWVPYPHQNLPAVAGGRESLERWVSVAQASAGAGGGSAEPIRFGPFAVPPCREILVQGYADGAVEVAADVYPSIGLVAKAAGRLAGNPWLSGGDVGSRDDPLTVSWRDGLWTVAVEPAGAPLEPPSSESSGREIGLLELDRGVGPLPRGRYRLEHSAEAVVLTTPSAKAGDLEAWSPADAALLLFAGSASGDGRAGSGLVLFDGTRAGSSSIERLELPDVAVFYRDAEARWKLPGEGLARLLGSGEEVSAGEWRVRAWSREAVDRSIALLDEAPSTIDLVGDELGFVGVVEWAPAARLVGRVADVLEALPLLGRREAARWRAWDRAFAACPECSALRVVVRGGEASVRLERSSERIE